jgi:hypothetical protein
MSQPPHVDSFANDHAGCGIIGVICIEVKTKPREKASATGLPGLILRPIAPV